MTAKLISEEGDLTGLVLSLDNGSEWIIGRDSEECQLVIPDLLISRRHARAYVTPEGIYIENLSETNPLVVNDEEIIDQPILLHHGDNVKFGNEVFRYYTDSEAHILDSDFSTEEMEQEALTDAPTPIEDEDLIEAQEDLNALIDPQSEKPQDTIFEENEEDFASVAEINFGLADFGRWLIKVVNGPNNGAEFYMQSGYSYLLGTDPKTCDIVFHDKSVSRQHARITVTEDDQLYIEDLNSKNGVLVSGRQVEGKETLEPTNIVTLGTTAFIVYDREGEMQTIISPLLPSIVKVLQAEEEKNTTSKDLGEPFIPANETIEETLAVKPTQQSNKSHFGKSLLFAALIGLFLIVGIGTHALFKNDPVEEVINTHAEEAITKAMAAYPSVKWAYNKSTGSVLLIGHVSSAAEKSQLLYSLHSIPSAVKTIDDSGIVIDEGVWREANSILSKTPAFQGITIHSPEAGKFILSGTLKTRQQAEQLYDYVGINFPYLDLLKRDVVVEEDILHQIQGWLLDSGFNSVSVKMIDGEVTLTGSIPANLEGKFPELLDKIRGIHGVRTVYNLTQSITADLGVKNITGQYQVTGSTKIGNNYTVQINGRILSEGDSIDNMLITKITPNGVFLEDGNKKFRIDYKG